MSGLASCLDPVQLRRDLGLRDLSDPAEGPHAVQILIGQAVGRLCRAWDCELRWCSGPRIVPVADNYDRLGYPAEAITRDARYTRYVDAGNMLRSHSSAMIPRRCAGVRPPTRRRRAAGLPGDRVPPGRHRLAARRHPAPARPVADHPAGDEQHRHGPDDRGPPRRARPGPGPPPATAGSSVHARWPPGRCVPRRPLGGGLGMRPRPSQRAGRRRAARPRRACPRHGPGPAAMLVKHIPDIRLLRSGDPRVTGQMLDLARYQHVSSMPPVTRDLSVAVAEDEDEETLATGPAMPSAPTRAVSRKSGCFPPPRTSSCPRQRSAASEPNPGRRTSSCASSSGIWKDTHKHRPANALRDRIYRALHQGHGIPVGRIDPSLNAKP